MKGFRVYDEYVEKYVTDEFYWLVDSDGALKSLENGDLISYPHCVREDDTGLTDKNDTKIFEGDIICGTIVSQWSKRKIVCEVVYERDSFISKKNNGDFHKLMFAKNIEVIGNIHDNPELLEEKNNESKI